MRNVSDKDVETNQNTFFIFIDVSNEKSFHLFDNVEQTVRTKQVTDNSTCKVLRKKDVICVLDN
jgi:hypothetical protein